MLTVRDIAGIIEEWAPREIAWERDNVGLQVGAPGAGVKAILVSLDVDETTVREAVRRRADLIVSHHPLIFRPLNSLSAGDSTARTLAGLLKAGISLYSAHTNLDFARGGTSFAIGHALKLREIDFLVRNYQVGRKIVTYVPAGEAETVANAMADAGAGVIGNYDHCSFRSEGTGTFRGNEYTKPSVGTRGTLEHVREVRLEMITETRQVAAVVSALRNSHPYEEVACDVYPIENRSEKYGMGIIGALPRAMQLKAVLGMVKQALKARSLRYTGDLLKSVRRVAACGGSGSELIDAAVSHGADVFITADIKYHTFRDAAGRIALIDAGHFETENPVIPVLVAHLKHQIQRKGHAIPVYAARTSKNPIRYV